MTTVSERAGLTGGWRARAVKAGLWLVCVTTLAACTSTRLDGLAPVEDRLGATAGAQVGGASASSGVGSGDASPTRVASVDLSQGSAGVGGGAAAASAAAAEAARNRVVYFDYDSYVVKDEYRTVVELNARALGADGKRRMLVEGHTDDRGGREYNLALGQKRADAVVRAMLLLGARDEQLEAVSYGKERPAVTGSGESVWARNRRAELKDR